MTPRIVPDVTQTCAREGCALPVAPCTAGRSPSASQAVLCYQHRRSLASMESRRRRRERDNQKRVTP